MKWKTNQRCQEGYKMSSLSCASCSVLLPDRGTQTTEPLIHHLALGDQTTETAVTQRPELPRCYPMCSWPHLGSRMSGFSDSFPAHPLTPVLGNEQSVILHQPSAPPLRFHMPTFPTVAEGLISTMSPLSHNMNCIYVSWVSPKWIKASKNMTGQATEKLFLNGVTTGETALFPHPWYFSQWKGKGVHWWNPPGLSLSPVSLFCWWVWNKVSLHSSIPSSFPWEWGCTLAGHIALSLTEADPYCGPALSLMGTLGSSPSGL